MISAPGLSPNRQSTLVRTVNVQIHATSPHDLDLGGSLHATKLATTGRNTSEAWSLVEMADVHIRGDGS